MILYDGMCGLCNRFVTFVLTRDRAGVFLFAALQSATGLEWLRRLGADADAVDAVHIVTNYRSSSPGLLSKSAAAMFVVGRLRAPWRWLAAARVIPKAWLDRLYDLGARHRYRLFGRYDTCPLPTVEHRARFVD